jgi:hypothetical protein
VTTARELVLCSNASRISRPRNVRVQEKTFALGMLAKVATRFRSWARSPYHFLVLNGIVCFKNVMSESRPWSSDGKGEVCFKIYRKGKMRPVTIAAPRVTQLSGSEGIRSKVPFVLVAAFTQRVNRLWKHPSLCSD